MDNSISCSNYFFIYNNPCNKLNATQALIDWETNCLVKTIACIAIPIFSLFGLGFATVFFYRKMVEFVTDKPLIDFQSHAQSTKSQSDFNSELDQDRGSAESINGTKDLPATGQAQTVKEDSLRDSANAQNNEDDADDLPSTSGSSDIPAQAIEGDSPRGSMSSKKSEDDVKAPLSAVNEDHHSDKETMKIELNRKFGIQSEEHQGINGLIAALGGKKAFSKIPTLKNWNGTLDQKLMTAPIMKTVTVHNGIGYQNFLFIYFAAINLRDQLVYQVNMECISWNPTSKNWYIAYGQHNYLSLFVSNDLMPGSLLEKQILGRIERAVKGQAIGLSTQHAFFTFPLLNQPVDLKNAYLKGEELSAYTQVADTCWYESEIEEGKTGIFLYDPRMSHDENKKELLKTFPQIEERIY